MRKRYIHIFNEMSFTLKPFSYVKKKWIVQTSITIKHIKIVVIKCNTETFLGKQLFLGDHQSFLGNLGSKPVSLFKHINNSKQCIILNIPNIPNKYLNRSLNKCTFHNHHNHN